MAGDFETHDPSKKEFNPSLLAHIKRAHEEHGVDFNEESFHKFNELVAFYSCQKCGQTLIGNPGQSYTCPNCNMPMMYISPYKK